MTCENFIVSFLIGAVWGGFAFSFGLRKGKEAMLSQVNRSDAQKKKHSADAYDWSGHDRVPCCAEVERLRIENKKKAAIAEDSTKAACYARGKLAYAALPACTLPPKCSCCGSTAVRSVEREDGGYLHGSMYWSEPLYGGNTVLRRTCAICSHQWDEKPLNAEAGA